MEEFISYGTDTPRKMQALFASLFVLQNRVQTAGEKVQTEISMRQWHLLAMTEACTKARTLTNLGALMGCSRQNVKKLALSLQEKGFVLLSEGANNSVYIKITEKAQAYLSSMEKRHAEVLRRLFSLFSVDEISLYFTLQNKLLDGLKQVEIYADHIGED